MFFLYGKKKSPFQVPEMKFILSEPNKKRLRGVSLVHSCPQTFVPFTHTRVVRLPVTQGAVTKQSSTDTEINH